jgi:hypothetical protein
MRAFRSRDWTASLAALSISIVAPTTHAAGLDIGADVRVGDTYTDNPRYEPNPAHGDNIGGVSLNAVASYDSSRTRLDLRGSTTQQHYFQGTYSDRTLRGFSGNSVFTLAQDKLTWLVSDVYGPVLADPLSPNRPDNLTYDNYFSTGPDLTLGSADQWHGRLSGRYQRSDYEDPRSPDNQQTLLQLGVFMPTATTSEISLQLRGLHTSEDDAGPQSLALPVDYNVRDAFLRLARRGARDVMNLDAGYSWVNSGRGFERVPMLLGSWGHRYTAMLRSDLQLGTHLTDGMQRAYRQREGAVLDQPTPDSSDLSGPLKEQYAHFQFMAVGARTTAAIGAGRNKVRQLLANGALSDQTYDTAELMFARRATQRWTITVGGQLQRSNFGLAGRRDELGTYYVESTLDVTRNLQFKAGAHRQSRNSSAANGDYRANLLLVEFKYVLAAHAGTATARSSNDLQR